MGVVLVRRADGAEMAFVEPSRMTENWSLKLGPPLLSPGRSYAGYLRGSCTGVLNTGIPFSATWASQIMSATAWLNAALLAG